MLAPPRLRLVLTMAFAACSQGVPEARTDQPPAKPELEADASPAEAPMQAIHATLRVDADPESPATANKAFQGVWLVSDDGTRHLIASRPEPWWKLFDGRKVTAKGTAYEPPGQAIKASHFRVEALRVIRPTPEDPLIEILLEREIAGAFETHTGAAGTKLEDETMTVFQAEGGAQYWLYNVPEPAPTLGDPVRVTGHEVMRSPFSAHAGGRTLWVVAVDPG